MSDEMTPTGVPDEPARDNPAPPPAESVPALEDAAILEAEPSSRARAERSCAETGPLQSSRNRAMNQARSTSNSSIAAATMRRRAEK